MADGIMIASDCADWWEAASKNRQADLEEFVTKHPKWWGIAIATAGGTALDAWDMFFVDLLRLGEGAAEGTVKGFLQDIFRVMSVVPQAKVLKGVKVLPVGIGKAVQVRQLGRLWRTVQGELCVPIAIAQAMQRTGQKLAVGLKEIADNLGQPLIDIYRQGQNHWPTIGPALTRLGVKHKAFSSASMTSFDDVVQKAATADGPLLVRVIGTNRQGKEFGHAILVAKTRSGVQIIDRFGFAKNLDELSKLSESYGLADNLKIDNTVPIYEITNAVVDESLITLAKEFGALASLARMSIGIFDFNYHEVTADFVKEQFEKFVGERHSGEPGSPGSP